MILWLIMTIMTAGVVALLARPFWSADRKLYGTSSDVYRAQLSEIEREEKTGIVASDDARMARIEVQRRLIASSKQTTDHSEEGSMSTSDRMTFLGVAALVIIGSGLIYLQVGRPELKNASPHPIMDVSTDLDTPVTTSGASGVGSVETMIRSLELRLEQAPDDVEGWRMLGWSKFQTDDFTGASEAYKRALELDPDNPLIQSVYGEAIIRANGGFVTPEAKEILSRALSLDPDDARARFLLGLGKEQAGNDQEALDDWLALLADGSPEDGWYSEVRDRVIELSAESGIDVTDRLPDAPPQQSNAHPAMRGPTPDQVSEAQTMSPQERQAMIENMVNGLDARLHENPDDLEGWIKLISARKVLRQTGRAETALQEARDVFKDNPAALTRLDELTQSAPQ